MIEQFYLGWDVGGWNCDKNALSRDALVLLNAKGEWVGSAWRGNLRDTINQASTPTEFITAVFGLCDVAVPDKPFHVTLAIDTPLGFSDAFVELITQDRATAYIGLSQDNPYLYRATERFLFERGIKPLSPIKDMIGSQATKGIHFLSRFAPNKVLAGVWSDGSQLTAFEGYPSACKRSPIMQQYFAEYPDLLNDDKRDALWCALIAFLFDTDKDKVAFPHKDISMTEGWIFVPLDAFSDSTL